MSFFLDNILMDDLDFKIILLMIINSRLPYREIGEYLGLSVNAVYKRMQNLIDSEIIEKFTARINPYAAGAIYAFILGQSESKDIDQTAITLGNNENTSHIMLSSRNFIYIGAYLRSLEELHDYVNFISEGGKVTAPQVGLLYGVYYHCPIRYPIPRTRNLALDKLDLKIIQSLHNNSRKALSEVAQQIKTTAATVRRRLKRMLDEGMLELTINFNPNKSSDIFSVFRIRVLPSVDQASFAQTITEEYAPHIFFIWSFSNLPHMLLCWVWCNSMNQLNELIERLRKGPIETLISDIIRKGFFFNTWKEKMLYEWNPP
ncbi:MAG: putative AsnC family transcriptional regulator [Promethearchaeota archaeon]|nr:MAG: putative AsnC family transcriptional regulator [Candidatus Lokiarchaeota archaeon]